MATLYIDTYHGGRAIYSVARLLPGMGREGKICRGGRCTEGEDVQRGKMYSSR